MLPTQTRLDTTCAEPLEAVRHEMGQVFNHFLGNGQQANGNGSHWIAPLAIWEEEGRFCLDVEMPGVAKGDVELTVEAGRLTVQAQRKAPESNPEYLYNQRKFGATERTISLPEYADADSIEAELRDGILHVTIAKKPEAQPKRIPVKTE